MHQEVKQRIYLVQTETGRVICLFASKPEAEQFKDVAGRFKNGFRKPWIVVERTLWHGQPPVMGFNQ